MNAKIAKLIEGEICWFTVLIVNWGDLVKCACEVSILMEGLYISPLNHARKLKFCMVVSI